MVDLRLRMERPTSQIEPIVDGLRPVAGATAGNPSPIAAGTAQRLYERPRSGLDGDCQNSNFLTLSHRCVNLGLRRTQGQGRQARAIARAGRVVTRSHPDASRVMRPAWRRPSPPPAPGTTAAPRRRRSRRSIVLMVLPNSVFGLGSRRCRATGHAADNLDYAVFRRRSAVNTPNSIRS